MAEQCDLVNQCENQSGQKLTRTAKEDCTAAARIGRSGSGRRVDRALDIWRQHAELERRRALLHERLNLLTYPPVEVV